MIERTNPLAVACLKVMRALGELVEGVWNRNLTIIMHSIDFNPNGVLFVCTGNLCRSPLAATLFAKHAQGDYCGIVRSAGIRGVDGQPAHALAQEQAYRRGLDLSGHRARTVTPQLLMSYDLILAMEVEHQVWMEQRVAAVRGKVYLLGHWRNVEISDPLNGGRASFERILVDLEPCVLDWLHYICDGVRPAVRQPAQ